MTSQVCSSIQPWLENHPIYFDAPFKAPYTEFIEDFQLFSHENHPYFHHFHPCMKIGLIGLIIMIPHGFKPPLIDDFPSYKLPTDPEDAIWAPGRRRVSCLTLTGQRRLPLSDGESAVVFSKGVNHGDLMRK